MEFKSDKPIYKQIIDFCFLKILLNEWLEDERIPSVRELGALLQVNPNTAMRAFEYMQSENIIYLKRGMGYYTQKGAAKVIAKIQKEEFFSEILPQTFDTMDILNVSIDEIIEKYNRRKKDKL